MVTTTVSTTGPGTDSSGESSRDSLWWSVPSWLLSLCLHAALLLLFASTLLTGGGAPLGDPDGEYRSVGLVERAAVSDSTSETPAENTDAEATDAQANPAPRPENGLTDAPTLDEKPPVELPASEIQRPVLGAGAAPAGQAPQDARAPLRANGIQGPAAAAAAGIGLGTADFFGVRDKATRVVYVVDCSGSMTNYNAIRVAKSELMASLQGLERTQQFQILFYNQNVRDMRLNGDGKSQLHFATDINRTLARQFIDSITADLGTDHMPALKQALRLTPEVIFLLTDADEPQLTSRDMNEIKRINQGRTRIHCIEFGKGAELVKVDNFLKRLARENGGSYRYRDVTRFTEKR